MQVRVFEAENMQAALRRVKQELGPQAIIISTRTVRKGRAGVLNKPKLEVTAALESEGGGESAPGPESDASVPLGTGKAQAQATYARQQPEPVRENRSGAAENVAREKREDPGECRAGRDASMELIQGELAELRQIDRKSVV